MKILKIILLTVIFWTLAFVFIVICYTNYIFENEILYYKNKPAEIKTVKVLKKIYKTKVVYIPEVIYIDNRTEIKE